MRIWTLLIVPLLVLLSSSPAPAQQRIRLATTTSTDNSGLLDVLLPPFEEKWGVKVDVIAVGTGRALKLGENGDVDVVLVHARSAEDEFIEKGFGTNRRDVMYNDFVLVAPPDDPAGIKEAADRETYHWFTIDGEMSGSKAMLTFISSGTLCESDTRRLFGAMPRSIVVRVRPEFR